MDSPTGPATDPPIARWDALAERMEREEASERSVAATARRLLVRYESADALRQDYETNLSNGGVFVPTSDEIALRAAVVVALELEPAPGCGVELEGEVVHRVPPQIAGVGGTPGVAVQFRASAGVLRDRIAPLLAAAGVSSGEPAPADHRVAPRKPARVSARIDAPEGSVAGRTRDLSSSGVLVGVQRGSVSIGETVRVALRHPTTGEEIEVDGRVARELESGGRVAAVAVQFAPAPGEREAVERFVESIQSIEHARRLGGIYGTIAELGIQSLVQMFASAAPVGTLVARKGCEEATLCFDGGLLSLVRLGTASGMKALVRVMTWQEGSFEFHARIEEPDTGDLPLPLEAAVLDAILLLDEARAVDPSRFPPEAHLAVVSEADSAGPLSKVEAAVLDLARAGFSVQRVVDVIPEPDPEIYRALESLLDEGRIELR